MGMSVAGAIAPATPLQKRVLLVAIVASFIAFLDGFVVNLALPAISREIGGGLVIQQWVVDGYLLTLGALILVAGSLSDLFGRARVMEWGLAGYAATSLLCGIAWSGEMLVLARILQGVAGALVVPGSLALIVNHFDGPAQSRAIGRWSGWTSGAAIAAPFVGGVAVDYLSWRFVFLVNVVPIALIWPAIVRLRRADTERDPSRRVDYAGAALAIAGLGGAVYGLIEQGRLGWQDPRVLVPLALGVLALAAFILYERHAREPMLPLELFAIRNFGWGNIATTAIYAALTFGFFFLGIYLQQIGGMSATLAGIALLPATLILMLASSYIGGLAGRFGPRWFMTSGPALCGIGFLLMLGIRSPLDYWTQVLPGQLVFGVGLAVTVAPLTAAILGAVPQEKAGIGSAINNAVARIAGLVCVAFAGVIIGPVLTTRGLYQAIIVTAVLLFIGAAAAAIGIRNPEAGERPTTSDGGGAVSPPS